MSSLGALQMNGESHFLPDLIALRSLKPSCPAVKSATSTYTAHNYPVKKHKGEYYRGTDQKGDMKMFVRVLVKTSSFTP